MYFFYNPKTNKSEGPYSIDMLRELISKEQIQPNSKLCPVGGKKWIDATEIAELFGPVPVSDVNNENDDFVHPLSQKGILQQQKIALLSKGFSCISSGILILFSLIPIYYFFSGMKGILGAFGGKTTNYSFYILLCFIIFCSGILISLGIYLRKKGKRVKIE